MPTSSTHPSLYHHAQIEHASVAGSDQSPGFTSPKLTRRNSVGLSSNDKPSTVRSRRRGQHNSTDPLAEQLADLEEQLVAEAHRCSTFGSATSLRPLTVTDASATVNLMPAALDLQCRPSASASPTAEWLACESMGGVLAGGTSEETTGPICGHHQRPSGISSGDELPTTHVQPAARPSSGPSQPSSLGPTKQRYADSRRHDQRVETLIRMNAARSVVEKMPAWFRPVTSPGLLPAGRRFDREHQQRTDIAMKALNAAQAEPDRWSAQYTRNLAHVRRGRVKSDDKCAAHGLGAQFWTAQACLAQLKDSERKKRVTKARWQLPVPSKETPTRSIWSPRAAASDSRSLYDTEDCVKRMFDADWARAIRHGMGEYIVFADDDGDEAEIDEAKAAMHTDATLVYSAFYYLAGIGGGDVWTITLNSFSQFVKDAQLADNESTNCKKAHLDQLFILINNQQDRGPPPTSPTAKATSLASQSSLEIPPPSIPTQLTKQHPFPMPTTQHSASLKQAPAQTEMPRATPPVQALGLPSASIGAALGALTKSSELPPSASQLPLQAQALSGMKVNKLAGWGTVRAVAKVGALAPAARTRSSRQQAAELASRRQARHTGNSRALERHEWLQALVRIAIMRYVLPGERSTQRLRDVSEAVTRLLHDDIVPRLDRALGQVSNNFRREHCYIEGMEKVLQTYEPSLRAVYNGFATDDSSFDVVKSDSRLSLEEWLEMCKAFFLLDRDVTQREAILAFVWSRPHVIDEMSKASQRRMAGLSFEDFLEALIRMALMKGWPPAYALKLGGDGFTAAEFLENLRETDFKAYDTLLKERSVPWDTLPFLANSVCVRNLIELMLRDVNRYGSKPGKAPDAKVLGSVPYRRALLGKITVTMVREFRAFIKGPNAPRRR